MVYIDACLLKKLTFIYRFYLIITLTDFVYLKAKIFSTLYLEIFISLLEKLPKMAVHSYVSSL